MAGVTSKAVLLISTALLAILLMALTLVTGPLVMGPNWDPTTTSQSALLQEVRIGELRRNVLGAKSSLEFARTKENEQKLAEAEETERTELAGIARRNSADDKRYSRIEAVLAGFVALVCVVVLGLSAFRRVPRT